MARLLKLNFVAVKLCTSYKFRDGARTGHIGNVSKNGRDTDRNRIDLRSKMAQGDPRKSKADVKRRTRKRKREAYVHSSLYRVTAELRRSKSGSVHEPRFCRQDPYAL